jgi:hypothetical protein
MTRPELFVFIALAVGWVAIAAWTLRISNRVSRLSDGNPTSEVSGAE